MPGPSTRPRRSAAARNRAIASGSNGRSRARRRARSRRSCDAVAPEPREREEMPRIRHAVPPGPASLHARARKGVAHSRASRCRWCIEGRAERSPWLGGVVAPHPGRITPGDRAGTRAGFALHESVELRRSWRPGSLPRRRRCVPGSRALPMRSSEHAPPRGPSLGSRAPRGCGVAPLGRRTHQLAATRLVERGMRGVRGRAAHGQSQRSGIGLVGRVVRGVIVAVGPLDQHGARDPSCGIEEDLVVAAAGEGHLCHAGHGVVPGPRVRENPIDGLAANRRIARRRTSPQSTADARGGTCSRSAPAPARPCRD